MLSQDGERLQLDRVSIGLSSLFDAFNPRLDAPLVLDPSCTVFHYAQTVFEGMKAYRDEHEKVTLFRPDMNMKVRAAQHTLQLYLIYLRHSE